MKTLLSLFCEEFDRVVRPLLQPITRAADTLNQVSEKDHVKALLPTVLDVRHQIGVLADKVAEQKAYVLIFGPLKSGKSTLMNAISGAYVSEVTTLPAYPCMVYVSHDDKRAFTVTRYNGETQEFSDMDSMRTLMEWAHNELADRLREVESRGETFDPQVHIPQAIRRVDVGLPATHLEQSSASLVDTPGLYTRMKFGYDRLTREFRNTAASAIFVVKTDNLFFEQVFAEFEDLLKMFSRIFLVVNIDSTKRDLYPDGHLGPSIEGEQPDRIVTAFENLSMTAPLKKACDEGRLRIYPVDLLQAASERILAVEREDGEASVGVAGFYAFLDDLSEYLNSTDYMVAFLGDSLRQAWSLLGELESVVKQDSVHELDATIITLSEELARIEKRTGALKRLYETPWPKFFGKLGEDLASIAAGRIEKLRESTASKISEAVDEWFENDSSFQSLGDEVLQPVLQDTRDNLVRTVNDVLETVAGTETAGSNPTNEVTADMSIVGIHMGQVGRECIKLIDPMKGLAQASLSVSTQIIPVRRGFFDYLLLRRMLALQRRLFGPESAPNAPVSSHDKARKLGEPARQALQNGFEVAFNDYLMGALDHISIHALNLYVETLRRGLKAELRKLRDAAALQKITVERRLGELRDAGEALSTLRAVISRSNDGLAVLSKQYGQTDPATLDQLISNDTRVAVDSDDSSDESIADEAIADESLADERIDSGVADADDGDLHETVAEESSADEPEVAVAAASSLDYDAGEFDLNVADMDLSVEADDDDLDGEALGSDGELAADRIKG
jgi:signal recognition particle receptor subunit beta